MFKRILNHPLVPPVFADDEEKTRVASLLNVIVLASLTGAVFYLPFAQFERIPYILVAIAVIVSVWLVMKHGYIRAASVAMVLGLLAVFVVVVYTGGGLRAPAYSGLMIVILFAGLLLGWRAAVNVALFNILYGIFLLSLDSLGMFPPAGGQAYTNFALWVIESIFFVMLGTLLTLALRMIEAAFGRARQELTERKQAEAELQKSEERNRKVINSARDVIFTISAEGLITSLNPAFEIYTGWSRAEWLGRAFDELIADGDRARAHDQFNRILHGETLRALRLHMHTRAGELLVVEMNISPQFMDDQVLGLLGIARDMTQEQQAEDALKASEQAYAQLLKNISGVIYRCRNNKDWTVEYISEGCIAMTGYRPEEIIKSRVTSLGALMHPDDVERIWEKCQVNLAARKACDNEYRIFHRGGEMRWVRDQAQGVYSDAGELTYIEGLITDITERKQAEREMTLLSQAIKSMHESMVITDENNNILFVNHASQKTYGYESHELIGRHISIVQSNKNLPVLLEKLSAATIHGTWEGELINKRKDGSEFPIHLSSSPVLDEEGKIIALIGVAEDITERKQAEEALRESETRLRLILQTAIDAFISIDVEGMVTEWNPQATLTFGWTPAEAIGRALADLIIPEQHREAHWRGLKHYLATGVGPVLNKRIEIVGLHRDGHIFPVELTISPVLIGGRLTFSAFVRDITERKRAEEQLRYQASLLANINDAVIAADENNRITAWNAAAESMYGWQAQEVLGQIATEIVKTEFDGDIRREAVLQALAATGRWRGQVMQARRDGSRFYVESASIALRNTQRKITDVVSVNRDITERRRAEEKVQQQNRRLKALREIDAAILSADSVENIVSAALDHIRELIECRRASLTLIDWETNEALTFDVRTSAETSIPSGTRMPLALFQDMLQALSQNRPVLINDLRELADPPPQIQSIIRDGLRSLCVLPLFSQRNLIGAFSMSSETPGFFGEDQMSLGFEVANQVAVAITQSRLVAALNGLNLDLEQRVREREKLIAELSAKNAELERFTYTVSHDLKSPLVTIKGFLGYLEQDTLSGNVERVKGDTQRIASAVEKMQELLNDLLELSRIGRFLNKPESISFSELARSAVDLVWGRLQESRVTVQIQPDLPLVYVDRQRLTEVLQNLLDNAAKYLGAQPEPRIEVGSRRAEDGAAVFYVRDNGIGIALEYHEQVFGLFNKLDARTEGTGVGLALVKRIIEFHGGRIWVESEVGKGSTFLFTLPPSGKPQPDSVI